MKRISLLLAVLTAVAVAQPAPTQMTNVVARSEAPTYSDLHCAGFLSKQEISGANYIAGGLETPHATQFAQGDIVFLEGSGYQEGAQYSIVRELRDPNRYEPFRGQRAAIRETGQPYADLGRVRVSALRGSVAVAVVEFSCSAMTNGDRVVPFQEKAPISYRGRTIFERFPAGAASVTGRILMAKDFDTIVGTGQKVYLNVGSDKGVKVGDYFRAVRDYDPGKMGEVEVYSLSAPAGEDTQRDRRSVRTTDLQKLPRRALGEMIVLNVTPTSATAMLTLALEAINVGDTVEKDTSVPVKEPSPPVISCSADRASVQRGGRATIRSTASSPDNRPLMYSYSASSGSISGAEATATLDTAGAQPGPITVTCSVSDDRSPPLTAASTTIVTVEAPTPPPPPPPPPRLEASKLNDINFKPSSARIDNVAKAVLDGVALRMQRDPDANLMLVGESDSTERNAQKLAAQRARNAKAYLVNDKGIDPRRIETRTGSAGGQATQIWLVPRGVTFNPAGTNVVD